MARVSSKYSNTKIVEYSTILIIEFGFGENTLTEKNIRGVKRKSSGNPIPSTKVKMISGGTPGKIMVVSFS